MDYVTLGFNFRMSNIIAALGLSQLKKLDKIIEMRRGRAKLYDEALAKIDGVTIPHAPTGLSSCVPDVQHYGSG